MGRISTQEAAMQAGVSPERVTAFVDLGILRPADGGSFSEGDVRRARVVEGLELAGMPREAKAKVMEQGDLSFDFLDLSVYDRSTRLSDTTFRDLSAQHSIPLELLMVMRETIGFARPRPEDRVREDELASFPRSSCSCREAQARRPRTVASGLRGVPAPDRRHRG